MNCPSRTDDDILWHPGWNQNPPRFAPDLTTCADLNGIANARELGEADRLCNPQNLRPCNPYHVNGQEIEKDKPITMGEGAKGSPKGPCTRTTSHVTEYPAGLTDTIMAWAKWLASVLCTAVLISHVSGNVAAPKFLLSQEASMPRLPRRSTCEDGKAHPDYDLPLHVGGLFIILFVSGTGCAFPMLVLKFPRLRIPPSFLFGAKHFGTGVLVATAFVHLLPTAFDSLGDPCLSSFWTTDYQAMPGAIMLASVFFVTLIEMIFSPARHVCGGNEGVAAVSRQTQEPKAETKQQPDTPPPALERTDSNSSLRVRDLGALKGRVGSISRTLSRYREDGQRLDAIESVEGSESEEAAVAHRKLESDDHVTPPDHEKGEHGHLLSPEQIHRKAIMQVFLLEMGILFHSIFIGMSLAVSVGNDFTVLLIAIVFHQTFEGLALGVRIADVKWKPKALQPWLMALAYGCTTPGGMAIGIATHTLYSPDSEIGLLVVGIMNAISAGFLVYASLVELMSEDFLSDESWKVLTGKRRVYACLLVFVGAFLMSLVGAWA
ncbi:hypothetical protein ACJQWK_10741 [Exserohilum turcicum]|uniref:Uncharacterized protein n=1 Tax=Exserohilum turcicum (strain 28A) TaxID=671987 RepID=R0JW68_EXST2|nr:uncharacterized protein SETTUDRAFT_98753 [Exserohilum turcica Et28A]EOA81734.1 hypothetical protein SETTUDRAFT_98753 [Exserohilum turcica Et28A]